MALAVQKKRADGEMGNDGDPRHSNHCLSSKRGDSVKAGITSPIDSVKYDVCHHFEDHQPNSDD